MSKEMLEKIFEKAEKNGFNMASAYNDRKIWHSIIFSHEFAKALGYKLAELGAWCDECNDPLKYLEKYV